MIKPLENNDERVRRAIEEMRLDEESENRARELALFIVVVGGLSVVAAFGFVAYFLSH